MSGINMPQRRQSGGIDAIARLFSIYQGYKQGQNADAQAELAQQSNQRQQEEHDAKMKQRDDLVQGIASPEAEATLLAKDFTRTDKPSATSVAFKRPDGTPIMFEPPKARAELRAPIIRAERDDKTGKNFEVWRDPSTGQEIRRSLAASQPKDEERKLSKITSASAQELGAFEGALMNVKDIEQKYSELAAKKGSGLRSLVPGSDADLYEKNREQYAQAIGTVLEKGKLTDEDYKAKYMKFIPSPFDTNQAAAEKLNSLEKLIVNKQNAEISGLEQSGFDTSGLKRLQVRGDALANWTGKRGRGQGKAPEFFSVEETATAAPPQAADKAKQPGWHVPGSILIINGVQHIVGADGLSAKPIGK